MTAGFTLDAGALIAAERGSRQMKVILRRIRDEGLELSIPGGVLAQVWRASPRQHQLQLLLADPDVEVVALDRDQAMAAGAWCAASGTSDPIDASVVSCARTRRHVAVTSDPGDLHRIDPELDLVVV